MEKYEAVIVGAGPAGLKCAETLAKVGKEVLVLEKNSGPANKICTGLWGISSKTEIMNLPESVFDFKFRKAIISGPVSKKVLARKRYFNATLDRKRLNQWQVKEAEKAGAEIEFGSSVKKIAKDYVEAGGRKIYFENIVGADGSYSVVRRSLNLPVKLGIGIQYKIKEKFDCPEIHFDAESFGPWYSWIAPHRNFAFVGAGADCEFSTAPELKSRLEKWLSKRGINFCSSEFEGAPIQADYRGYRFGNKFLAGDAAGFASGWWGEGIYFAMASGEDAAKTILDESHNPALIKKILGIKRRHELIMNILRSNPHVNKMGFGLGFYLMNYNFFREWLVELVC